MPLQPFFRLVTFVALSLTLGLVALTPAFAEDEKPTVAEWETVLDFDSQIFPSYIISTATMKPDPTDEEENDSTVLGDQFGIIGIAITVPEDNTKVKVTVKKNKLMDASVWEGEIPKAGEQFFISPQIAYDYDALRKVRQQAPLNISLEVEIDGKPAGSKSATAMIHSINDCPFGVAHSEEMGEDNEGYDDLGWMFALVVYARLAIGSSDRSRRSPQLALRRCAGRRLAIRLVQCQDGRRPGQRLESRRSRARRPAKPGTCPDIVCRSAACV